jgi:hypothetical protein
MNQLDGFDQAEQTEKPRERTNTNEPPRSQQGEGTIHRNVSVRTGLKAGCNFSSCVL